MVKVHFWPAYSAKGTRTKIKEGDNTSADSQWRFIKGNDTNKSRSVETRLTCVFIRVVSMRVSIEGGTGIEYESETPFKLAFVHFVLACSPCTTPK